MNNGKIIICTLDCRHLVELIEIYSRIDLTDSRKMPQDETSHN